MAGVDPRAPDRARLLEATAAEGARGLRLRATARSPEPDPLAIWRAAAQVGLPVSCLGSSEEFADDAFAEVLTAVPDLVVVLEHLGSRVGGSPGRG